MSKGLWQRGIELRERTMKVLGTALVRKYNKWYAKEGSLYLGSSISAAMKKLDQLAEAGNDGSREE